MRNWARSPTREFHLRLSILGLMMSTKFRCCSLRWQSNSPSRWGRARMDSSSAPSTRTTNTKKSTLTVSTVTPVEVSQRRWSVSLYNMTMPTTEWPSNNSTRTKSSSLSLICLPWHWRSLQMRRLLMHSTERRSRRQRRHWSQHRILRMKTCWRSKELRIREWMIGRIGTLKARVSRSVFECMQHD